MQTASQCQKEVAVIDGTTVNREPLSAGRRAPVVVSAFAGRMLCTTVSA